MKTARKAVLDRSRSSSKGGRPPQNLARFEYCEVSNGLDILNARFSDQHFSKHSHGEYVVGIIRSGLHKVWCRGEWWHVEAGTIATLSPDEPHHGGNGNEHGWAQTMFYIPESTMHDLLGKSDDPEGTVFHFDIPFHRDQAAFDLLTRATDNLGPDSDQLLREQCLIEALRDVSRKFARRVQKTTRETGLGVRQARDFIHCNLDQKLNLTDLSLVAELSKNELLEQFKYEFGLSPYQYVCNQRVVFARELIKRGVSPIDAATDAGFVDQSHMSRHFRRILGITPGQYATRPA